MYFLKYRLNSFIHEKLCQAHAHHLIFTKLHIFNVFLSDYLAYHLILKEVADSIENLSINLDAACGYDHRYNEIPLLVSLCLNLS